jgi:hypothetical protein
MSRKHFESVAKALKSLRPVVDNKKWENEIKTLADEFATFNTNFDKWRFFRACGLAVNVS